MTQFKKFVLAAVLAVGGATGAAVIDSPLLGSAKAWAGGAKYFTTYSAAKAFADQKRSQGYFATVLKSTGGLYMVEYWSKH